MDPVNRTKQSLEGADDVSPKASKSEDMLPHQYDEEQENNDERRPFTPRDSVSSSESDDMMNISSYLTFFRSPASIGAPSPGASLRNYGPFCSGLSRRHKTPTVTSSKSTHIYEQSPMFLSSNESDDDDSESTRSRELGTSYVPTHYSASKSTPRDLRRTRISLGAESRRSLSSSSDGGDTRSVASLLFGESLLEDVSLSPQDLRQATSLGDEVSRNEKRHDKNDQAGKVKRMQLKLVRSCNNVLYNMQSWTESVRLQVSNRHRTALPMSPRSRDLADIQFLQEQHRRKMKDVMAKESQGFDFCLILQPQEVYAFWAELLDFRTELLGEELATAMEQHWEKALRERESIFFHEDDNKENDVESGYSAGISPSISSSTNRSEARDFATELRTPRPTGSAARLGRASGRWTKGDSIASPSLYSVATDSRTQISTAPSTTRPPSMFERALGPLQYDDFSDAGGPAADPSIHATPGSKAMSGSNPNTIVRRKWGSQTTQQATCNRTVAMSPPVHTVVAPVQRKPLSNRLPPLTQKAPYDAQKHGNNESESVPNPHEIKIDEIPNQKIPRGIAARTKGLSIFLPALRRGLVLRKHRPGQEASFCKIVSTDGGDSIQIQALSPAQAYPLLREQRRLFNPSAPDASAAADWSLEPDESSHNFAQGNRSVGVRHFTRVVRRGMFRISDVVAVHPARREDPRSTAGDKGTLTLRRSHSEYAQDLSFSLVLRSAFARSGVGNPVSIEEFEIRWGTGEGNESQFRYFDFEAATEGEYWLIFRGFLLLQRDAAVGRFAEQRAAGIGSHYRRLMGELQQKVTQEYHVHDDEFREPITVGPLERLLVEWRGVDAGYMKGYTAPGAVPPPSDYFLGFRAPGTAIWSRLRNAGLSIHRVYSLDRRQVILKINCPVYRIMDVAEVLRVKLKTWDGSFASFRQDMIDLYQPLNDPLEGGQTDVLPSEYVFASSVRQQIIDFIIRSRIRDSGAEIGQTTVKRPSGFDSLGKMIQARVPLHMHGKLSSLYGTWVRYWEPANWTALRDSRSRSQSNGNMKESETTVIDHGLNLKTTDSDETGSLEAAAADASPTRHSSRTEFDDTVFEIPPFWKRLFVGAFFQPLDSIEEYFGEKVAFYFAWLEHTATHLVFLSAAGLFLFICQIASGTVDHPLRPVFALVVMIWTYVVLVNWRKRANLLAYRWGTMNYKEQETTRPQFRGDFVEDEITGEDIVHYPKWRRWLKYAISFPVTLLFTGFTLLMILWVHANRDMQLAQYLEQTKNKSAKDFELNFNFAAIGKSTQAVEIEWTREIAFDPRFWFITLGMPALLGLCLPLLNFALSKLSILLNDFENYRTESEYRTHLIIKVFSFRFVCYFATLYYYAFVSTGDPHRVNSGIFRVGTGVLVYTTVAHWWQVFLQVYAPLVWKEIRLHYWNKRLCRELREVELEEEALTQLETSTMTEDVKRRHVKVFNKRLLLEQAQDDIWLELMLPEHDSFVEYIQAVVQFTFITCFSVVLPITPLICLLNYLLSMRLDAYKLCKARRRPLAQKTGGIGVWEHLLHIVAVISVLTNCWLIVYTNSEFIWLGDQTSSVGLFVTSEHVMLLVGYIMMTSISKMPKSVRDAMKREKHELDEQRNSSMRSRQNHRSKYHREEPNEIVAQTAALGTSPVAMMTSLTNNTPRPRSSTCAEEYDEEAVSSDRVLWSA